MSYVFSGWWHFAAAMAFAVAFGTLAHADPTFYLRQVAFTLPLLIGSSALFFVPDKWARKGALKFLHYPLPDWDMLLLGPASHRNWLSHSPVLPMLLLGAALKWTTLASFRPFSALLLGTCLGIGSHLFWDCVGSARHKIVFVPYWFALREAMSRLWLLGGAVICLCIAWSWESARPGTFDSGFVNGFAHELVSRFVESVLSAFARAQKLGL